MQILTSQSWRKSSGIYRDVITVKAHEMNFAQAAFGSCFANCSLEHMDNLEGVLARVRHAVKPRGEFLLSVATDRFVDWNSMIGMLREAGHLQVADGMEKQFLAYHHLVNALPIGSWIEKVASAGFEVEACVPIIPGIFQPSVSCPG